MRRLMAMGMVLASVSLWLVGAQSAHAANFVCNEIGAPNQGMTADVPGNVTIPADGQCNTFGWNVGGSILVGKRAKLFVWKGSNTKDTTIKGSIVADGPKQLNVSAGSVVKGSVTITGPNTDDNGSTDIQKHTFGGFICAKTVGGSVNLQDLTAGRWVIGDGSSTSDASGTGGEVYDFFVSDHPDLTCTTGNGIGGSVNIINNQGPLFMQTIEVSGNTITGSVTINNNTVHFERIEVEGNKIGGGLACSGNTATTPSGIPMGNGTETNTASSKTGQCAGF